MGRLEHIRSSFIKMRGGKLISVESFLLAFTVFFVLTVIKGRSVYLSLVIAFMIGFLFPILTGSIQALAWLTAILFSLVWGFLGFLIAGTVVNGSCLPGLLIGTVLFVLSFRVHKDYSGLTFQKISPKGREEVDTGNGRSVAREIVQFCPECGRRIVSKDGICHVCNK